MGLDKIGKYKVIGKIAEGAMGEVYRAHDPFLDRHVAIKTIAPALGRDAEFRRRFEREAQAAAQLNHPHIVTVFDFGEEGGITYMAMELLEGRDLRETLSAGGPATLRGKLDLMQQICDGVAFAHAKGVVHRDLKPGNIHIQPNGQAKVLDFGLARVGLSEITRAGTVMGTPHYMSPEQVRGQRADPRSDVFALGAIFYEVLTGQRPFGEDSSERIFQRILREEPPAIRGLAPGTPDIVVALVERALSKDPTDRFADAGAMGATLRRIQESLPPTLAQEGTGPVPISDAEETLTAEGRPSGTAPALDATAVAGTTALAPNPMGLGETLVSTTVRPSATAVAATTQIGSRRWLWAGGVGVLLVAAVGTVAWLALRRAQPSLTPDEAAEESVGILTDALVSSQVELAREDLNNRHYEAAVERAERALELSPGNSDAEEVLALARSTLQERDAAVQSARAAYEAGDFEQATQSLSKVMSIDPRHPVVDELSGALNERFRREAESARDQARRARAAAEAERASEVQAFSVAGGLEREAAALFWQKEYTSAAQKWIEARDAFESARRAARIARATPAPTPVAATPTPSVARVATPPPRPTAPPPATTAPGTGAPVVRPPARPEPAREASAAVSATPEPTPVMVATPDPRAAVRQVLADYERVFETKDLDLYRSIKVTVSSREEEGLRKTFEQIDSQQLDLTIHEVELVGNDRAVVRTSRHDVLNGDERPPMKQVFRLVRKGDRWQIDSFEFPR